MSGGPGRMDTSVLTQRLFGTNLSPRQLTRTAHRGRAVFEGRAHHDTLRRRSHVRCACTAAIAALLVLGSACAAAAQDAAPCCADPARFWQPCTVVPPTTADSIRLRIGGVEQVLPLGSTPLKNAAFALRRPNDALAAISAISDLPGPRILDALGVEVCWSTRAGVMLGIAVLLLLLAALIFRVPVLRLADGLDGPYSGSTWQMLVWFVVLVIAYGSTIVLRWWAGGLAYTGGVEIPAKLLTLAGVSAATFAGARAIRSRKERRLVRDEKATKPVRRFPSDLVRDEQGDPDLASFQMIVVTTLAVVLYVVRVFAFLGQIELACEVSLPEVDSMTMAAVAASQGAYLVKKAATPLRLKSDRA